MYPCICAVGSHGVDIARGRGVEGALLGIKHQGDGGLRLSQCIQTGCPFISEQSTNMTKYYHKKIINSLRKVTFSLITFH